MKRKLLLYIFLLCATVMQAQKEQLKKADRYFNEYAFPEAAEAYREYLKKERKPSKETIRRIADSYYNIREYGNAVQYYERLYKMPSYTMDDEVFNRYIQSLLMDGNIKKDYEGKADELLKERLGKSKDKTILNKYLKQKKSLDSINATEPRFTINNIKANSDKADFGTAFYGDKIVYSSSKDEDKTGRKIYKWNEQPFLELFVADRDTATGNFINEEKFFPKELNNYHNATLTFTPDLKTVYFSNNNVKKSGFLDNAENGTNNLRILKADIEDGKLVNETSLKINKITYSVSHPALTPDGKWMFFTSDMPGGEGETDIYIAKVQDNGQLSDVKKLGKKINTTGKEGFPFVQNGKLYFASNGHYGMGGLDVYVCDLSADMKLSEPVNMGASVNSNMDDFAFIISKDETYGYLSSNRKKGRGDDDIYYFTVKPKFNPVPEEVLVTELDTVDTVSGNPSGTLDDLVRKEGDNILIDVNPIYFDLDKYDITPRAEQELAKVIYVLENFPSVVIKIESHTDSRQTHKYNITLSENRARSTYNYLISKGIDPARIESYKGYGETRLKNRCSDDVPCAEEEHQLNRRSDFIIVRR